MYIINNIYIIFIIELLINQRNLDLIKSDFSLFIKLVNIKFNKKSS